MEILGVGMITREELTIFPFLFLIMHVSSCLITRRGREDIRVCPMGETSVDSRMGKT